MRAITTNYIHAGNGCMHICKENSIIQETLLPVYGMHFQGIILGTPQRFGVSLAASSFKSLPS